MKAIYLFVLTAGLFASCVSLEVEPVSQQVEQLFYRNESDAIAAVNAIYVSLHADAIQSLYNGLIQISTEMATDDYAAGPRARNAHVRAISALVHDASNNRMEALWQTSYDAINRANIAVDKITEIPAGDIREPIRQRLIAEAKFLRALHYFNLVRWFGGIPLVLHETTTLSSENLNVPNATEDEIYAQITQDLKDAESLPAPADYSAIDIGRATAGAAKSLLAKVYLTRQEWQNAADKAQEVISTGWYDLFDDFADVFDAATKNGKEHIFSVQYEGNANYIGNGLAYRASTTEVPGISGEYADMVNGGSDIYTSYVPNDRRLPVTFATELISPVDGQLYQLSAPHLHKYFDPEVLSDEHQSSRNFPVIRYAEVLLIRAEALNELSATPTTEAYTLVDKVRQRAGIDLLATVAPSLTKDEFRDSVFQERRKEFVYEHQRWFDLSRRGPEYYIRMLNAAGKTNAAPRHVRFPIPQRELDLNPNLKQNPEWTNY